MRIELRYSSENSRKYALAKHYRQGDWQTSKALSSRSDASVEVSDFRLLIREVNINARAFNVDKFCSMYHRRRELCRDE